jgi:N-acetylglucosaminyl-diphospho-decaprenol L-rhamnosyltransferase
MDLIAAVVVVAYGVDALDFDVLPPTCELIVVHNDDRLGEEQVRSGQARVTHLYPGSNIGFGAGVNSAVRTTIASRVILVNPDARVGRCHIDALMGGDANEVVTVPLQNESGTIEGTVNPYPGPVAVILSVWRVGRFFSRDGRVRSLTNRGSLSIGRAANLDSEDRVVPLCDHWVSGALVSYPTEALRAIDGFDEEYFLYVEDLDLSRRLAARFPHLVVRKVATIPAFHAVGGTTSSVSQRRIVERHRAQSWKTFATRNDGTLWILAWLLAGIRVRTLKMRMRMSQ